MVSHGIRRDLRPREPRPLDLVEQKLLIKAGQGRATHFKLKSLEA